VQGTGTRAGVDEGAVGSQGKAGTRSLGRAVEAFWEVAVKRV